ncbi:EAL and HDOD domain-containing protein [Paucibacter sp. JuS9]|uniref:EAL and HDOD domain-containing protein n=1 Tax=Roseateles TaxID=93681 RepID=UPI002FE61A50
MSSSSFAIWGSVALGYAPMIDRQHQVVATRLTVFPLRPDLRLDAAELITALAQAWPEGGKTVVLNAVSESLLTELLQTPAPKNLLIELPAFMASDPAHAAALAGVRARGGKLVLKGRPLQPITAELQACFNHSLLDLDDERGGDGTPPWPGIPKLVSGVRSDADILEVFKRNAAAVLGWPMQGPYEPPAGAPAKVEMHSDLQIIVQLMAQLDQGEDSDKLERTLQRDPTLAFKLLRYMNSAAFGLPVEVSSFKHAIMLLGYARLKRWLALLLATASKDHSMRPIMFGALRRGLIMEELARGMDESDMRDEMFICGLFSFLDHMLKQPFAKLLEAIPMPERVRQALVDESGPYQPYLELVKAIEHESAFDFRSAADQLMLGAQEINDGVMRALAKASQLE